MDELRNKLADALHKMWSRWILDLFTKHGEYGPRGIFIINGAIASEFLRQAELSYTHLPDDQLALDMKEVDNILALIPQVPSPVDWVVDGDEKLVELQKKFDVVKDAFDTSQGLVGKLKDQVETYEIEADALIALDDAYTEVMNFLDDLTGEYENIQTKSHKESGAKGKVKFTALTKKMRKFLDDNSDDESEEEPTIKDVGNPIPPPPLPVVKDDEETEEMILDQPDGED